MAHQRIWPVVLQAPKEKGLNGGDPRGRVRSLRQHLVQQRHFRRAENIAKWKSGVVEFVHGYPCDARGGFRLQTDHHAANRATRAQSRGMALHSGHAVAAGINPLIRGGRWAIAKTEGGRGAIVKAEDRRNHRQDN